MSKLWDKGDSIDALIEAFTVGDDYLLDQQLVCYDCIGSIAHAAMLYKIGILDTKEVKALFHGLKGIKEKSKKGFFPILQGQEDVHTAVENALCHSVGEAGKKLHTCRSRNDQVLVDLRLYTKDKTHQLMKLILNLAEVLSVFADTHSTTPVPGRTHMQRAMPSSLGLWAGAMAEALMDSSELLKGAYALNNQSPLGAGASYGSNLPIDRAYTAQLLGFDKVQNNVLYVNNSRGKIEAAIVHSLTQLMADLSKMGSDLMFFSLPEVGYLTLASTLCSGSSLMPQKHNPCALELIRAKAATVIGCLMQILEIMRPLPSGYHRDFQETKRPLLQSFEVALGAVGTMIRILEGVTVNEEACKEAFSPELFATDQLLELATEGIPFRDAYKIVASNLEKVTMADPVANIEAKQHLGAPGNLGLNILNERIKQDKMWLKKRQQQWLKTIDLLQKNVTGEKG